MKFTVLTSFFFVYHISLAEFIFFHKTRAAIQQPYDHTYS